MRKHGGWILHMRTRLIQIEKRCFNMSETERRERFGVLMFQFSQTLCSTGLFIDDHQSAELLLLIVLVWLRYWAVVFLPHWGIFSFFFLANVPNRFTSEDVHCSPKESNSKSRAARTSWKRWPDGKRITHGPETVLIQYRFEHVGIPWDYSTRSLSAWEQSRRLIRKKEPTWSRGQLLA